MYKHNNVQGENRVIFVEKATPGTLIEFKDALSNTLLSIQDPWSVEIRTYRTQVQTHTNGITGTTTSNNPSPPPLMYSLNFSHHEHNTVLIKNNIGALFTNYKEDSTVAHLRRSDCSTGFPEEIDSIILNKMTSLWDSRQVLRGEAGETFKVVDGVIRCVNLFSSTGFKGLIIEIEEDRGVLKDKKERELLPGQVSDGGGIDTMDENDFIEVGLDEASTGRRFLDIVSNTRELLREIGVESYRISLDRLGVERDGKTVQDSANASTFTSTSTTAITTTTSLPATRPGPGYLCDLGYQYVSVLEH